MRPICLTAVLCAVAGQARADQPASEPALCVGAYADDLGALNAQSRATDADPRSKSSYYLRNTAVYECVSYGPDGSLRRKRRSATLHGTAFGYRKDGDDTLLLTNQHVAEWPAVTDEDHVVDSVPAGCKKVSESLKVVDDEHDDYDRDDVPLVRVVSDAQLDTAILRAHASLGILPWKIGRSSAMRERNVVEVKGYPLGAFEATNFGKVVSAHDHDDFKDWDHDDFVVDALLSPGNSGSPVLAVSCVTGELELVGVYHAAYSGGSALNVVVGIDQLRDLMTTLKRTPRPHADAPMVLDGSARARLTEGLRGRQAFFPFGPLTAAVRARSDGAIVFVVYPADFPLRTMPMLALEDLPLADPIGFGQAGRLLVAGEPGLRSYARADLDADAQAQVGRILDALRSAAIATFDWRAAVAGASASRVSFEHATRLRRTVARTIIRQRDVAQGASDLADRLAPGPKDAVVNLATLDAP